LHRLSATEGCRTPLQSCSPARPHARSSRSTRGQPPITGEDLSAKPHWPFARAAAAPFAAAQSAVPKQAASFSQISPVTLLLASQRRLAVEADLSSVARTEAVRPVPRVVGPAQVGDVRARIEMC